MMDSRTISPLYVRLTRDSFQLIAQARLQIASSKELIYKAEKHLLNKQSNVKSVSTKSSFELG